MKKNQTLFRPALVRLIPAGWLIISFLYLVHAAIRFGGLWNPLFYPLSMVVLWPLPWILSPGEGRDMMGFRRPLSGHWFGVGPLVALIVLVVFVLVAELLFGAGDSNWLLWHARYLRESVSGLPPDTGLSVRFMAATLPAMLFSPLAEEFLYRGFMLTDFSRRWGLPAAMLIQASAFALLPGITTVSRTSRRWAIA